MSTTLRGDSLVTLLAAVAAGSAAAPDDTAVGFVALVGRGRVRTYVSFGGTVTSVVFRLWLRSPGATSYSRAASSTDLGWAPTSAIGREARDWRIGDVDEWLVTVESLAGGGSVTLKGIGVGS